jgi:xylulokinase
MHGATCINKNHEIIRPCILWNDTRSHQECSEIMADNSVMDIAGNIAMPGFTAPKVLWIKNNETENFDKIYKALLPKDYLRFYLTGEFFSDLSDASGTYWLDVEKRDWSQKLLEASSMNISQMPNVCEGTDQTGIIKKDISEKYGFNLSCKVYGGAGDNAAAAVGLGLYDEGDASISLGTSGVIFGSTKKFLKNYDDAIHSFCHCLPNTWHLMSVMLSCTSNINWFINTFESSIDEITKSLKEPMSSDLLMKNSPYYLPYLTGERTPLNDPHVRASFHNMGIETNRSTLVYSLIEGISFGLFDNYQALSKTGIKLNNLFVIGGGSKNEDWIKLLASILDRDLAITEASDAMAAYGAARLAYLGYNNLKHEDVLRPPSVKKVIEKDNSMSPILQDRFAQWKNYYVK